MPEAKRYPVAVALSDIHLCSAAPISRSSESNWLECQKRYLHELVNIADDLPIFCAGDVFDKWSSNAELINLALEHLPCMHSVAGNHDLPHHSYKDIKKSAYWTLCEAGKITNVGPESVAYVEAKGCHIRLHGFPWGYPAKPLENPHSMYLDIALVHDFIWTKDTGYPGAPPDKRLKPFKRRLRGYDVAIFGDNHKSVFWNLNKRADSLSLFNPGSFMRRNADQVEHRPCVGMVFSDGSINPVYLDTSGDKLTSVAKSENFDGSRIEQLIAEILAASTDVISFRESLERCLKDGSENPRVKRYVLQALDEAEG